MDNDKIIGTGSTVLCNKLIKKSGLTTDQIYKQSVDFQFGAILHTLQKIHTGKAVLYGDYIKTHGNQNDLLCLMQLFADMKRKWLRFENWIDIATDENQQTLSQDELLDTFSDLAVYSVMAIQMLDYLEKKRNENEK